MPTGFTRPISPRLRELMDCGLVRPVDPEPCLDDIGDFEAAFVERFQNIRTTDPERLRARVHRTKATMESWRRLERYGLARRVDDEWMGVPPRLALEYLSYLAVLLAKIQRVPTEPLTDQTICWNSLASPTARGRSRDAVRAVVLHNLLPSPTVPVSPRDIAAFKAKHWDLLDSFRRAIEREVEDCVAVLDDYRVARERADGVNRRLQEQIVELQARMAEVRWPTTADVVAAAILVIPPAVEAVARTDPFAAATAAAVPLAEIVRRLVAQKGTNWNLEQPLAYATLASAAFSSPAGSAWR